MMMVELKAKYPTEIFTNTKAKVIFHETNNTYGLIQKLGYIKMPNGMYYNWLVSLKVEIDKYQNKNIKFEETNTNSK